jgi:hypothetical protein
MCTFVPSRRACNTTQERTILFRFYRRIHRVRDRTPLLSRYRTLWERPVELKCHPNVSHALIIFVESKCPMVFDTRMQFLLVYVTTKLSRDTDSRALSNSSTDYKNGVHANDKDKNVISTPLYAYLFSAAWRARCAPLVRVWKMV